MFIKSQHDQGGRYRFRDYVDAIQFRGDNAIAVYRFMGWDAEDIAKENICDTTVPHVFSIYATSHPGGPCPAGSWVVRMSTVSDFERGAPTGLIEPARYTVMANDLFEALFDVM